MSSDLPCDYMTS